MKLHFILPANGILLFVLLPGIYFAPVHVYIFAYLQWKSPLNCHMPISSTGAQGFVSSKSMV